MWSHCAKAIIYCIWIPALKITNFLTRLKSEMSKLKSLAPFRRKGGDERTLEWKQEVAELRQGNSETWIIPGYGLNVDSRKNGKVYLSFEGEIAEFVKGRRLRAWRVPW